MIAGLSRSSSPELSGLTTRDPSDPSLAMLDAWAIVADILTFYQERIANEGYLRTATERQSVVELSRLVGYTPKPGVASSVYLAFTLESGYTADIAAGQRVQSLPAPGEVPQTFETSELLRARSDWNIINPRTTQPQIINQNGVSSIDKGTIYLKGTSNNVKPNDLLLFVFGDTPDKRVAAVIQEVNLQPDNNRTEVILQKADTTGTMFTISIAQLFPQLSLTPSIPLADSFALIRDPVNYFEKGSDAILQTLVNLNPDINQTLYPALGNARAGKSEPELQVYVVRAKSSLFGYNARQNPPVANFTMSQTSPTVDDTLVQFTDTSTGAPSSWLWDFGDGATSTNQNPQHTFQAFGNLTVSLKVTNDFGFNTIKETVTVQQQIK
jgi:hypothetical protein